MADPLNYQIHGDSGQFLAINLQPDQAVIAEAGMMMYLYHDVELSAGCQVHSATETVRRQRLQQTRAAASVCQEGPRPFERRPDRGRGQPC